MLTCARISCLRLAIVAACFLPIALVSAQQISVVNEAALTKLYAAYEKSGEKDAAIQKKITQERARVRTAENADVTQLVDALSRSGSGEAIDLAGSYERQRSLVYTLQARTDEVKVDLDLLKEEERKYYASPPASSGSDAYRITNSYSELLAKRAVLEERLAAISDALALQQDRLQKLSFQQKVAQVVVFAGLGKYLLAILLIVLAERFLRTVVLTKIRNRNRRYAITKIVTASLYLVLTLWILTQLFTDYPGIVTSFAIVGAGIAVALQDVIKDFVGWVTIVQKRMFKPGQRVSVGPYTGDIIDIGLLRTTLLEASNTEHPEAARIGQTLYIPNAVMLREPLLNFHATSDYVEAEMSLTITYESDWKRARELLLKMLHAETDAFTEKARRQTVHRTQHFYSSHEAKGARVFMDIAASGITFTLRFPAPIGERRTVMTKLSGLILETFAAAKPPIELAYDTRRVIAE